MIIDGANIMARLLRQAPPEVPPPTPGAAILGFDERMVAVTTSRPDNRRAGHMLLLASSGSGKTALLVWIIVQTLLYELKHVPREQWQCIFIGDPKNDTVTLLLSAIAAECPERLADCVYLNPFSAHGFPFNLNHLDIPGVEPDIKARLIADIIATVSTGIGSGGHGAGSRQTDCWIHSILAALSIPDPRAHVLLAAEALATEAGQHRMAALTENRQAKEFLSEIKLSKELRSSTTSRLRLCLGATTMQSRIFSARSAVSLDETLGAGKIVMLPVGDPPAGLTSLASMWLNLFGRFVIERLLSRPSPWPADKPHARVILDEVQCALVLEDAIERIATVGRSKGISGIYASQGTTLIADASPSLLKVLRTNTPTTIIGRSNYADSRQFASEQSPLNGVDEQPHAVQQKILSSLVALPDRSFWLFRPGERVRFRTQDLPLERWSQAAESLAGDIEAVKCRHALPPETEPRVTLTDLMPRTEARQAAPSKPRSRFG